jgi:hypothetical protein
MRFALFALSLSLASAGPIGYVFDGDNSVGYKVDLATGNATSFPTYSLGYPVAIVNGKIELGQRDDQVGHEYDLNGNATGVTFGPGAFISQWLDGTTDGTHDYAVQCCSGQSVYSANLFWQGATALFTLPTNGSGIAYDTASGTLFVSLFDQTVHQYSLAGVDLGSFSLGFKSQGLAYDKASDTLWALNLSGSTFVHLSTSGTVLGSIGSSLTFSNPYGFEIDNGISSVPEPATAGLLAVALGLLALRRRQR